MLLSLQIDNFSCHTNTTIEPGSFQLWLGENGTGKSTVLAILRAIQGLFHGQRVDDVFSSDTLCHWDTRDHQSIGFKLRVGKDVFDYHLRLEHNRLQRKVRIAVEELNWNDSPFFRFTKSDTQLYRINRESGAPELGTTFPGDWSRSMIAAIMERDDNWPLIRFREAVLSWLIIYPNPVLILDTAESESRVLKPYCENFAMWYRFIVQEEPKVAFAISQQLREILFGFDELRLRESGHSRILMLSFVRQNATWEVEFSRLSDGQKQLVVLYSILEAFRANIFGSVFIDEPDNFVALREIEPWVGELDALCNDEDRQAIIISHHPEVINRMARGSELVFLRRDGGPTYTKSQLTDESSHLTPAELVARGWVDA